MPQLRHSLAGPIILALLTAACADPSSPPNLNDLATLRFVNATSAPLDLVVGSTVVRAGIPSGLVFEQPLTPRSSAIDVGVRSGSQTRLSRLDVVNAREHILLVAHGTGISLGVLTGDTNTVRMDRVNVRVVFAASNAPLVKAYVQPETQSALGPLPWVSTQSAYAAPLFTTYYRGTPSTTKLTVIFAEYNPGGTERILAVSPAFDAYSGSAWLVTFDQTATGYSAVVVQEPVPLLED